MKSIKFYTVGCKVNQYETQCIRERFLSRGFQEIYNGQKADFYLVNTCTVTSKADRDSRHYILKARRENPKAKIIVTGCLTELDSDRIKEIGGINLIVKNKEKGRIFEHLVLLNGQTGKRANGQTKEGISYFKGHTRAFLKIQDGCDNFCSYCKVPLVRGESRSRRLKEIAQEAKVLVKNGFKEIVLTGICLGAYGRDLKPKINLVKVIEELEKIKGLLRIRLSSLEAGDISDELINKFASSKKLCRHLHIPIQSGDDEILKKMHRRYTRTDYLNLIKKIKGCIPGITITTDVLVGFPGESEINFQNTLDLIKKIQPLKVHIFPYSRREGTPAATNFKDMINPSIIKKRILQLEKIAQDCALIYKRQFLNKDMDVLIEDRSKDRPHYWQGYTDNYIKVLLKSSLQLRNHLISLKLNRIDGELLVGVLR